MLHHLPVINKKRKVFVLRVWQHDEIGWIAEVRDVNTSETRYVYGLEALFDLLQQKILEERLAVPVPHPPPPRF